MVMCLLSVSSNKLFSDHANITIFPQLSHSCSLLSCGYQGLGGGGVPHPQ